eukprot:g5278.t1
MWRSRAVDKKMAFVPPSNVWVQKAFAAGLEPFFLWIPTSATCLFKERALLRCAQVNFNNLTNIVYGAQVTQEDGGRLNAFAK